MRKRPPTPAAAERRESLRRWGVHASYLVVILAGILGVVAYDGIRREGTGSAVLHANYPTSRLPNGTERPYALKLATFNIASAKGPDGRQDIARSAETVRQIGGTPGIPLVVVLNEVRAVSSSGKNHAELLGDRLDMGWVQAASERRWWREDFGNGLLLSRGLALQGPITRLPLPQTQERGWRNLTMLTVALHAGQQLHILGTHIDRRVDQPAQLEFVLAIFRSARQPVVLLGDMNVTRDHPAIAKLLSEPGVLDLTPRLEGQSNAIELILAKGVKYRAGGVVDVGASDHPLRWAEVEVDAAAAAAARGGATP